MGKEIERKFLVNKEKWQKVHKATGTSIRQEYLLAQPERSIHIRRTRQKAFLPLKGASNGISQSEFEYEIPREDAKEILDQFPGKELTKIRYKIEFQGKQWEIDELDGENKGLIIAEIELRDQNETSLNPTGLKPKFRGFPLLQCKSGKSPLSF